MELDHVVIGTRLNEIQKKADEVKLVFEDLKTHKTVVLTFDGLLFETSASTLNKRVRNVGLSDTLGIRATTQLRQLNRNTNEYRQLFIQMEGSDENNKLELIGALRSFKVSLRRTAKSTEKKN